MRYISAAGLAIILLISIGVRGTRAESSFSPYVDAEGNISIPENYREWAFMGSWHIAPESGVDGSAGAAGFHNVYTQLSTIKAYRETGEFPDGAVIVKELLQSEAGVLTTGEVSWATNIEGWFVMVKDRKGRFPGHPLWGNGWGWVLFNADDPANTVTKNWRTNCLGCHAPASRSDWVFVEGYPLLRATGTD